MKMEMIEGFQLSAQQKRSWLLARPKGSIPCSQLVAQLNGDLNCDRLRTAVDFVVSRHEILRTTFHQLPGMNVPVQTVASSLQPDWHEYDLREQTTTETTARKAGLLAQDRTSEFDLQHGPLLRVTLITDSERTHSLCLTLPALCADAESLRVLLKEILRSYAIGSEVANGSLTEPVQYAQYAAWQEELSAGDESRLQSHWNDLANSVTLELSLPFELEERLPKEIAASYVISLPRGLATTIVALCREQQTSPEVLLLAAWYALLWRSIGQAWFVIAVARDGRNYQELQGAVGPLAQYLPHRFEPRPEMSFFEFLKQVRREVDNTSNLEEFYSAEVFSTATAAGAGDLKWPVGFEFAPRPKAERADDMIWTVEAVRCDLEDVKLKLNCLADDDDLLLTLEYDAGLFRSEDMDRLGERFRTLLENICIAPSTSLGQLGFVGETERHELLVEFNRTASDYPRDRCIHELFETQASLTPERIAVSHGDRELTYSELDARANQLAHCVTALGAGPEKSVGLLLERSTDMVLGIMGALKSGAAYVPFDPTHPSERQTSMIAHARVSVLLTHERFLPLLPKTTAAVVCLDRDWPAISGRSDARLQVEITPANAAYLIYTSGSTGEPKGVIVTHGNLVHSTTARFSYYREPVANFLLTSPFVFDSSVAGIFWTLCQGGTLTLPPANFQQNPAALFQLIGESRISHLLCVPSLYNVILEQSPRRLLNSLRTVMVAGEACPRKLIERHYELVPEVALYNEYGPTEVSVWSSVYRFTREESGRNVPIGRPISNTSIYLLDDALQPAPLGLPGEIYLGGAGLSRGYLNHPELTAERFVPDLFGKRPGERVYRTGDLGRYRSDGNMEFLGRVDNQVKISGHRIELGEIETTIEQHPLVQRAVVVAREQSDQNQLVAYLVPERVQKPSGDGALQMSSESLSRLDRNHARSNSFSSLPDDVRAFLKLKLPVYMLPSTFVLLDELPLTPNGKVDRNALPSPDAVVMQKRNFVAPRSDTERFLADIWSEVLGVEQLSVHDSFFELGGDSIKGIVLINKVQERLGDRVQLVNLLEAPRIADLAVHLSTHYPNAVSRYYESRQGNGKPAFPEGSAESAFLRTDDAAEEEEPLSFSQRRLWFLYQLDRGATYNIPGAVRLEGSLDVNALRQSFNEVICRHEILRVAFPAHEGRPARVALLNWEISLSLLDLSHLAPGDQDSETHRLMAQEAQKPFNLGTGPLFRATLIRLSARDHLLLVTMHHIISDGWSIEVLIRELAAFYTSLTRGTLAQLAPLPAQYSDFARWQRLRLQGESLEEQIAYWRRQLSGMPTALPLPTDYPRPSFQTTNGATFSLKLPPLSEKLVAIGLAHDASLFMTLLAAFKILLYYHSGQTDIVVGTDVANRSSAEFEGLIGFFVNQLVLLTVLDDDLSFGQVVARVREVALGAYAHQDLPFDRVVDALSVERDPSRNPLFQVLFAFHKQLPTYAMQESGLKLSLVEVEIETSAFDFSLHMTETSDGLEGTFRYNTDLFKETTISRLSQHFGVLLTHIAVLPNTTVRELKQLLAAADSEEQSVKDQSRQQVSRERYKTAKRKTVYS